MRMPWTKGQMIKELKEAGVRRGIKNGGALVSLEHLKYEDIINLWYKTFKPETNE